MFFHIRWAIKNLLVNRKRSLKKLGFMTMAITMVLFCFALLDGSSKQMKENLYYSFGDLSAKSHRETIDIAPVLPDMQAIISGKGSIFSEYTHSGNFVGSGGYAYGDLRGVEPGYLSYFNRTIGWNEAPDGELKLGEMYLEAAMAMKLQLKKGDSVSVRIESEDGFINANQYTVAGIFMGNPWLYENLALFHIDDMRELMLDDTITSDIITYYDESPSDSELTSLKGSLSKKYSLLAQFFTRRDMESNFVMQIFGYYRIFLVFILSMIIITFVIILYFSLQNIYYIEFRSRRNELSTMLTFGMKPITLLSVVIWETILAMCVSVIVSFGILLIVKQCLGVFIIDDLASQQLVALLGGNKILLRFKSSSMLISIGVIVFITIRASLKGSKTYLKMHIREIISAS